MSREVLAEIPIGRYMHIAHVDLDGEATAWLAAVGIHAGADVVVLRRATFGGPLHVRTSAGGEFAVAREVARTIHVRPILREANEGT